jgi:hypothetical protein
MLGQPVLKVWPTREPRRQSLAFAPLALSQLGLGFGLVGGNDAAHCIQRFALALPVALENASALLALLLFQCLALVVVALAKLGLLTGLASIVILARADI